MNNETIDNNETTGRGATTALSQLQQYVWSGPQLIVGFESGRPNCPCSIY